MVVGRVFASYVIFAFVFGLPSPLVALGSYDLSGEFVVLSAIDYASLSRGKAPFLHAKHATSVAHGRNTVE